MLELYHGTTSVCAQKARLTLAEKGLEWESHLMALNGDQLDPAYLKLNPNGVVPTLVHDGNVIVESTAHHALPRRHLSHATLDAAASIRPPPDAFFEELMDGYIILLASSSPSLRPTAGPLASLSKEQRDAQLAKAPLQRQSNTSAWLWRKGSARPWVRRRPRASRSCSNGFTSRPSVAHGSPAPTFARRHRGDALHGAARNVEVVAYVGPQKGRRPVVGAGQGPASYATAITKWLRPEDIARYEKIADPWVDVSKNLAEEARTSMTLVERTEVTINFRCEAAPSFGLKSCRTLRFTTGVVERQRALAGG